MQILVFQDATPDGLVAQLTKWPGELPWEKLRVEAARTRSVLQSDGCRLLLVVQRGRTELPKPLATGARSIAEERG